MVVRTKRFPEYDLSLCMVSGVHSCEEAVRFFEGLGPSDATRWLHCFESDLDMSGHDVACLPKLKRTIAAKQNELFGREPKLYVVVCPSKAGGAFFEFWRSFVEAGEPHGVAPRVYPSLEAACDALGLPEAARRAVVDAARDLAARPPETRPQRPPPSRPPPPDAGEPAPRT